jgi:hypothetical protein
MIIRCCSMLWRKSIWADNVMTGSDVQLVFDTNILVDALLARGEYYEYDVEFLVMMRRGELEGWYAPHSGELELFSSSLKEKLDRIRNAPAPPDDELSPLTPKYLERLGAFALRYK